MECKKEIWRDIAEYEGLYQVSNNGRIRNAITLHIISQALNNGYLQVMLWKNGKSHSKKVHRLVAPAFPEICGEKLDGYEIDHIDGDKTNNNAENLKYKTHYDNIHNPITEKNFKNRKHRRSRLVRQIINGETVRVWRNALEAYNEGIANYSHIYQCLRGERKKAGNSSWEYIN